MSKSTGVRGQKTTLIIYDPCPGNSPHPDKQHCSSEHTTGPHLENRNYHISVATSSVNNNCMELDEEPMHPSIYPPDNHDRSLISELSSCHKIHYSTEAHLPQQHGSNIIDEQDQEDETLNGFPVVVLDCANIGWAYGVEAFSAEGIQIVYDYFDLFHVNVLGFLPASYYRRRPKDGSRGNAIMQTESWDLIDVLVKSNKLVIVPAGDSDDLYILQFARQKQGFIVSNDFFSDHIRSLPNSEAEHEATVWINEFRCPYTFIKTNRRGTFMPSPASAMTHVLDNFRKYEVSEDNNDEMEI